MADYIYRIRFESISAMLFPQFYDFRTERALPGMRDELLDKDEFWHQTQRESDRESILGQGQGLRRLIREGELIRNVVVERRALPPDGWEAVAWPDTTAARQTGETAEIDNERNQP